MRIARASVLLVLLLAGCASQPPAAAPVVSTEPNRVLLVSFDGVGWEALTGDPGAGALGSSGWNRIAAEGVVARLIPVSPTLTSVTHISMATGTTPEKTGVVSNTLHLPGTTADQSEGGFEVEIETDTIWESARRSGKRVGVITYPGVDATSPRRTADFGLVYSSPVSRPSIQTVAGSDLTPAEAAGSFSPPRAARLAWKWSFEGKDVNEPVEIVAIDTTNDGAVNYDDFIVRHGSRTFDVGEDRWFPLSTPLDDDGSSHLFGSWSRIM
ncbi:MAG TPA: alkaline phosphatase family protein, partial [Thermoanaerobaculia bacterium]|nr:alkaline phosphatase family protein [Thermoanaerobaculia bacterium]